MHHHSVNKSPPENPLTALRSMVSSVFKRRASTLPGTLPHSQFSILNSHFSSSVIPAPRPVIPPGVAYGFTRLGGRSPAKAGIPQIPASRRNDNYAAASFAHSQFSILNFQFPSPRLLLTLLILPFIFALDLVYFTLARPGCAACGSLSGFLSTSSLTLTMINQNDTITSAFHSIKTIVARI